MFPKIRYFSKYFTLKKRTYNPSIYNSYLQVDLQKHSNHSEK